MAEELELGDTEEETFNVAKVLRVEFLDVFAAHPAHRKQAQRQELDELALVIARLVPEISTAHCEPLRRAAAEFAGATNGWPTSAKFAAAVQRVQVASRSVRPAPPLGWRWKRGRKPPEGLDASSWYIASLKQETSARDYLRADVSGRALAGIAHSEGWLCTLYWFVVDEGRLPSPAEEEQLIGIAKKADAAALEPGNGTLQIPLLALRQAMHDYCSRQLGLEARKIAA